MLAASPCLTRVLCGCLCNVQVWDLEQQQLLAMLKGHTGWVVSVAFIGATTTLVSASHDVTARLWDAAQAECLHVLEGHSGRLNAVAASKCGAFVVTCADDKTARVWRVADGSCIRCAASAPCLACPNNVL
jgi:WD40 repeat protein